MTDLATLDSELRAALSTLEEQAPAVANARALKATESDQRKQTLHGIQSAMIIQGDSVAASEVKARATAAYGSQASALTSSLVAAEQTIAANDVAWARFNALRELVKASAATAATSVAA